MSLSQTSPIIVQPAEVASTDESRVIYMPVRQFVGMSELKFSVPVIFRDGAEAEMFVSMTYINPALLLEDGDEFNSRVTEQVRMSVWLSCREMTSTEFITDKRDMILNDLNNRFWSHLPVSICKFSILLIKYSVRTDLSIPERPQVTARTDETAEADIARLLKNRY